MLCETVNAVTVLAVVDVVVPEHPDAADEPVEFCRRVGDVLRHELHGLRSREVDDLVAARMGRVR